MELSNPYTHETRAIFGDGDDGDVTTSGNVTLTRDMYYNNLTVATGHTITTDGFRVFVKEKLTINGTGKISANGGDGSDEG